MSPVLYATVADLRNTLSGTDSGTGTAAQLSDDQLTLALQAASDEISIYAGNIFDSSVSADDPPDAFQGLTLAIAAFYATGTYLKNKELPATHPVYLRYQRTIQILNDVRDGKLRLDPATVGGIGNEIGIVINRIPPIFTGEDSNTRINESTGTLEADVPFTDFTAGGGLLGGGVVFQG